MNLFLKNWMMWLQDSVLGLNPGNEAQEISLGYFRDILNGSNRLVDEILTFNVSYSYQQLVPSGGLIGFFIAAMIDTLGLIEKHLRLISMGRWCGCEDCLVGLRSEFAEVRIAHITIKLYLLVVFLQREESLMTIPKQEMIDYSLINYTGSNCPEIFDEALDALKRGQGFVFPVRMHFLGHDPPRYRDNSLHQPSW